MLQGSGSDDLARRIDIRRGEPISVKCFENGIGIAAKHRAHPGGSQGGSGGHGRAALAHEHHGLLGTEYVRGGSSGDLADAVAGSCADARKSFGGVGEQLKQGDEPSAHNQWLSNGGIADRVGVRFGSVAQEINAGHR